MKNNNLLLSHNNNKQLKPELKTGRWYFVVFSVLSTDNKMFTIEADYGLAYDDYPERFLVLLFIFPIIMMVLCIIPLGRDINI
jgi:hypothetical protein